MVLRKASEISPAANRLPPRQISRVSTTHHHMINCDGDLASLHNSMHFNKRRVRTLRRRAASSRFDIAIRESAVGVIHSTHISGVTASRPIIALTSIKSDPLVLISATRRRACVRRIYSPLSPLVKSMAAHSGGHHLLARASDVVRSCAIRTNMCGTRDRSAETQ